MEERIYFRQQDEETARNGAFAPYMEKYLYDGVTDPIGGVLVLPGGGYHARAYHEAAPIARAFNALGFQAFVLQYRVAPEYHYPAPQCDALRAIRYIRAHAKEWHLCPDQLAILGFSAGGHLAASCGVAYRKINADCGDEIDQQSARPDAMILCYPVISLTKEYAHLGSGRQLFGAEDITGLPGAADMELEDQIPPDIPPTFLWHTATDQAVPVRNSMEFARRIWEKQGQCELHVFPEGPHGRGLGLGRPDVSVWPKLAAKFLETTAKFRRA